MIAEKVGRAHDPFRALSIPYHAGGRAAMVPAALRGFTPDEDRFLLCMLNVLGVGAWEALRAEVRRADAFRFNWFMKSRTADELRRRCEALVRLAEKEAADAGLFNPEDFAAPKPRPKPRASGAAGAAGGAGAAASGVGAKRKKAAPAAAAKGGAGGGAAAGGAGDDSSVAGTEAGGAPSAAKKARAT